jgi:hypothetical protein
MNKLTTFKLIAKKQKKMDKHTHLTILNCPKYSYTNLKFVALIIVID